MQLNRSILPIALAVVALCASEATAVPAPTFTVTATNITLPGGKTGASSQITVASINGYIGQLTINCQYSGGEMNAKVPTCGGGVARLYSLTTANQSTQGALFFYPYGMVVPVVAQTPTPPPGKLAMAFILFGACFLGALRRHSRGVLALLFAAVFLVGVTSCGANSLSGTFPYTVTATDIKSNASVNTSITVTVP